jgi:hypothetical protein
MRSDAPLLVTETLLRAAAGLGGSEPPVPVGDDRTWLETVRLASAHLVLPALTTGLEAAGPIWAIPEEARHYLAMMHEANAARNSQLNASLVAVIDSCRSVGIETIAVKGGAFLLTASAAAPWRFLGDLDLMVPERLLSRAVEVLADLGYRADRGAAYDTAHDAHAPAMLGPDGLTIIELHSRPFAEGQWPELEAALWWDRRIVLVGGSEVGIPSPEVRAAYLLLHSQEHHAYFAQGRLLLRDLLDLAMLRREAGGINWGEVLRHIPERSQDCAMALLAAGADFGIPMSGITFSRPQRAWSERARRRLARPVVHRQLTAALSMARHETGRLIHDRYRTLRLARGLAHPSDLGRKLLKKLDKLRDRAAG